MSSSRPRCLRRLGAWAIARRAVSEEAAARRAEQEQQAQEQTARLAQETSEPLVFTGQGAEYFRIWIVNLALTVATLGIYSAWAKVRAGPGNLHSRISGNSASCDGPRARESGARDEQKDASHPQCDLQGQGRIGGGARRQDAGRVGQAV